MDRRTYHPVHQWTPLPSNLVHCFFEYELCTFKLASALILCHYYLNFVAKKKVTLKYFRVTNMVFIKLSGVAISKSLLHVQSPKSESEINCQNVWQSENNILSDYLSVWKSESLYFIFITLKRVFRLLDFRTKRKSDMVFFSDF